MKTIQEVESFVSCISGYYRLMVKWSMDLCPKLVSPWLKYLNDNKLHGPIGGAFSYNKIEEKNSSIGSLIIRQCESVFDTFYIDIVTKENQLETFRIRDSTINGDKWKLHVSDNVTREYEHLIDLIKSIETNGKYTRIPSSLNDKAPFLLLCQPPNQQMMKEVSGVRENNRPMILSASEDLRLYNWTQREWGDGLFTRMKAEIINRKKKEVTLKVLKQASLEKHLQDFITLGDLWAKLDISEIVKLYGITLRQPISYVMESISCGPLDELLRNQKHRKHITLLDLVETAFSLAKALHYLVSL
jgi:Janus kinase 2